MNVVFLQIKILKHTNCDVICHKSRESWAAQCNSCIIASRDLECEYMTTGCHPILLQISALSCLYYVVQSYKMANVRFVTHEAAPNKINGFQ